MSEDANLNPMEGYVSSCCKAQLVVKQPNDDTHTATALFRCSKCDTVCRFEPEEEE